ncbi:AprI/Inh family metalloprotease inhibitor [Devosia sp. RR2S18]|uniref:AprI/Inh family metalloprotease inhibitor n=1 Tax=Devosia rhizosphaerae TaxID=3049774 RepID=UPI00253FA3DF|nr:AprI/Inh family metalloprotease inhibitor [Devosia sp. RR2S18]WIJ26161.1 AprI/Inh family metalloprotease inhibitor [Devosia sp. RR2S18]
MMVWMRGSFSAAGLAAIALLVAGCQSTGSNTANLNTIGAPQQQIAPVQQSSVQQSTLPVLGGATGVPAPGLSGQPVMGGVPAIPPTTTTTMPGPGGTSTQVASNGSFVTLGPTGQPTSLGVSSGMGAGVGTGPEGVWNVTAGAATCRLNLPMTTKTGTNHYRASAPGCAVPALAGVSGWQQVGSQLQLYDENGNIAAFLAPNSGRYIGTLSGGQAISMSR